MKGSQEAARVGPAISHGARIDQLARDRTSETAIVLVARDGIESSLTWGELGAWSTQVARALSQLGVREATHVAIGLSNSIEHMLVSVAAWKLGATVIPINPRLPVPERDALLELADPAGLVADWETTRWPRLSTSDLEAARVLSDIPLPARIAHPGFAIGSGGSTGRSKIIVVPTALAWDPTTFPPPELLAGRAGLRRDQVQLVPAPLYHGLAFAWGTVYGLFAGHRIVLMERFDAGLALELVERQRVNFAALVPTHMQRMLRAARDRTYDLSSIQSVYHSGARCPDWVKREFIALLGDPAKLYEAFGATEGYGSVEVRGDEWLEHVGTVGRPVRCDLRVLNDQRQDLPPGEVGEIWMRQHVQDGPTYRYIGSAPLPSIDGGFTTVGDMGHVDEQGYVYPADRRVDLILSGGSNIYPAEVEAALGQHEAVADSAVIGLPDDEWGERVHAIVQPIDPDLPPDPASLDSHVRARIAAYKAPKSYEFVAALPRNDAGKIRRSALAAARVAPAS